MSVIVLCLYDYLSMCKYCVLLVKLMSYYFCAEDSLACQMVKKGWSNSQKGMVKWSKRESFIWSWFQGFRNPTGSMAQTKNIVSIAGIKHEVMQNVNN